MGGATGGLEDLDNLPPDSTRRSSTSKTFVRFHLLYHLEGKTRVTEDQCSRLLNLFVVVVVFLSFRAAPAAHGGSQARGPIGAIAAGLYLSHGNAGSKPHLRPTPQLMAALNP